MTMIDPESEAMKLALEKFYGMRSDGKFTREALAAAIQTYLDEAPDEPAPEGVEFDMSVYITSDKAGASTRLAFPGNRLRPPPPVPVNVAELIHSLSPDAKRNLLSIAGDWRVMTRAEIQAYKLRSMGVEVRALNS